MGRDILTGGNIPRALTPLRIQSVGGGLGSFSIFPVILRDQTFTYNGFVPTGAGHRYRPSTSTLLKFGGADLVSVDTTPLQYHDNRPATSTGYSVRHTAIFDSNVTAFVFDFPTIDVWRALSTDRAFDMARPVFGVLEAFTATIEIALTADLTDILARADIRFIWDSDP